MRRLLLVFVLVLASVLTASAGEPLYLWKVEGDAATLYLTGSVHVGKPEFFPLADPLQESYAAAAALAVEVDVSDPAVQQKVAGIMMQKGMLPPGETLQSSLNEATWKRLQAFAEAQGLPLAAYGQLRPGLVAMILAMEAYRSAGYDAELGIDKHFLDRAKADGKPVRSLETVEAQLDLFLQISDTLDDLLIDEALDQMADITAMLDRMIALWQAGDAEGMDAFMAEMTGDDPQIKAFYRRLLDERNVAMADQLDAWLLGDQDVFVVVGAGHYGGGQGLLKLLEAKGWKPVQIER